MMETAICTINGVAIKVGTDERQLVPIKPICQALGVDYPGQYSKLMSDEILGSTVELSSTVGADGKDREMACMPLEFVYGWLFTINPGNVREEARENVRRYRMECYRALYGYFNRRTKRQLEENRREIELLDEIANLNSRQQDIKSAIADKKKELEELRNSRLDDQPSLFD